MCDKSEREELGSHGRRVREMSPEGSEERGLEASVRGPGRIARAKPLRREIRTRVLIYTAGLRRGRCEC